MIRRVVVTGRPGSGKSTYVRENKEHGDLVWDFDAIIACMLGAEMHERSGKWKPIVSMMSALLDALVRWLKKNDLGRSFWIIRSDSNAAADIAVYLGASIVVMDEDADTCLSRLRLDPARSSRMDQYRRLFGK